MSRVDRLNRTGNTNKVKIVDRSPTNSFPDKANNRYLYGNTHTTYIDPSLSTTDIDDPRELLLNYIEYQNIIERNRKKRFNYSLCIIVITIILMCAAYALFVKLFQNNDYSKQTNTRTIGQIEENVPEIVEDATTEEWFSA